MGVGSSGEKWGDRDGLDAFAMVKGDEGGWGRGCACLCGVITIPLI